MTDQSENINELATALSKAQGEITGALKDSSNPFFKSKYADLAACWDACRTQLSKNGLAVIQTTEPSETGVTVVTLLTHSSGQWIRGRLHMTPKDASPQGIGSAITYARRYALAGIVGLAQVDDDGNAASGKTEKKGIDPRGDASADPALVNTWVNNIADMLAEDGDHAAAIYRAHLDLAQDSDLYICVADELAAQGVCSKARFKELVRIGKPSGKAA